MVINKLRAVVYERALLRAKLPNFCANSKYLCNENIFVTVKELSEELGWYDMELVIKLRGSLLNVNYKPWKK